MRGAVFAATMLTDNPARSHFHPVIAVPDDGDTLTFFFALAGFHANLRPLCNTTTPQRETDHPAVQVCRNFRDSLTADEEVVCSSLSLLASAQTTQNKTKKGVEHALQQKC
eukprot:746300-Hanusia_phi.AAC.1